MVVPTTDYASFSVSEQGIGRAAADAMAMKTVESTIVPRA